MKKLIIASILATTMMSSMVFAGAGTPISDEKKLINAQFTYLAQALMENPPQVIKTSATYQNGTLVSFERNSIFTSAELPKRLAVAVKEATAKGGPQFSWAGDKNTVTLMKGNTVVETFEVSLANGALKFELEPPKPRAI